MSVATRRTTAREKLSAEQRKVDRKRGTPLQPVSVRNWYEPGRCEGRERVGERSRRREGRQHRERGEEKREGAEAEPQPHISPTAFKFLSAADCVVRVFPWTRDRKLTGTVKRPREENICRRVVARKRIDRVIILSKVEGK